MTHGKTGAGGKPVTIGFVSDDEIAKVLSQQYRAPEVDLAAYVIDPTVIALVSKGLCERHTSIPVSRTGNYLIVAMDDPGKRAAIEALRAHTGLQIEPVVASEAAIREAIGRYYGT